MTLKNFRAVDKETYNFGKVTRFRGTNGVGKTTLNDAFSFLSHGKSSDGSADLNQFKPIRDGELVRDVETSVSIEFSEVTLTRILKENWVKKRGTTEKAYEGNTVIYEIDEVPVKKSEFDAKISEMFGSAETFRVLSDPEYVAGLNWKDRRNLVAKHTGIEAVEGMEKAVVNAKAKLKKIKAQGKELPARIDELNSQLTDVKPVDEQEILDVEASLQGLDDNRRKLIRDAEEGNTSDVSKKYNDQIQELEEKKRETQNRARSSADSEARQVNEKLSEVRGRLLKESRSIADANEIITSSQAKIIKLKDDIVKLQHKYIEVRDKQDTADFTCPSCNRPFDTGDVATKLEELNNARAENLKDIEADAAVIKSKIEALESEVETNQAIVDDNKTEAISLEEKELMKSLETINKLGIADTSEIDERIAEVKKSIEELASDEPIVADTSEIDKEHDKLSEELKELYDRRAQAGQEAKTKERIDELRRDKKKNGKEQVKAENEIDNLEADILKEIEKQESLLNADFKLVDWKLFNVQVNGGIEQVCTPMVNGIEYQSLNRAMQFAVGVDIINTLSKWMDKEAPIWVDNAEAYVSIPDTDAQVILLHVDEECDKLIQQVLVD